MPKLTKAQKREQEQYKQNFSEIESDLQQVNQTSDLNEVLNHLYKDGNILELTDLTKQEIGKISTLYTYSINYGFEELKQLIINNLQMRVSLSRKGRDESVKVANSQLSQNLELMKAQDVMDRRTKKG